MTRKKKKEGLPPYGPSLMKALEGVPSILNKTAYGLVKNKQPKVTKKNAADLLKQAAKAILDPHWVLTHIADKEEEEILDIISKKTALIAEQINALAPLNGAELLLITQMIVTFNHAMRNFELCGHMDPQAPLYFKYQRLAISQTKLYAQQMDTLLRFRLANQRF